MLTLTLMCLCRPDFVDKIGSFCLSLSEAVVAESVVVIKKLLQMRVSCLLDCNNLE